MSRQQPTGELALTIARRAGDNRSVAVRQFHQGALRILRPYYDEQDRPEFSIINPGGAYFGGDVYDITVEVETGASVKLTTQSATKVYRTPQGPARQEMLIQLGPQASLDYVPDQLIMYQDGEYFQRTRVEMDPQATLVMSEIITPGWSPTQQPFAFTGIHLNTEVYLNPNGLAPRIFIADTQRIIPAETDVLGLGYYQGFSHTGQLLLITPAITEETMQQMHQVVHDSNTYSGISQAGTPLPPDYGNPSCLFIRSLAHSTADIVDLHQKLRTLL